MFEKTVEKTIKQFNMLEKGDRVLVAVSGGPDSMSVLNYLFENKEDLEIVLLVCHVNHGIRENAKIDEEYVKDYCDNNNIKLFINHSDVISIAKETKRGLEETGRKIRYDFFEEIAQKEKIDKIVVAHNKNDNAETVIMNALRGSGLAGLKGIEPVREKYIRPLIECGREEIEEYCKRKNLNPRHDESNDDNTYTRNKIRNVVLPFIKEEFNPNIVDTLKRLSDIVKEDEEYINCQAKITYERLATEENNQVSFVTKEFNKEPKVIQKLLVLKAIKNVQGSLNEIDKINVEDVIKLCNNNIGNKYLLPNKNVKVEMKDKKIIVKRV